MRLRDETTLSKFTPTLFDCSTFCCGRCSPPVSMVTGVGIDWTPVPRMHCGVGDQYEATWFLLLCLSSLKLGSCRCETLTLDFRKQLLV